MGTWNEWSGGFFATVATEEWAGRNSSVCVTFRSRNAFVRMSVCELGPAVLLPSRLLGWALTRWNRRPMVPLCAPVTDEQPQMLRYLHAGFFEKKRSADLLPLICRSRDCIFQKLCQLESCLLSSLTDILTYPTSLFSECAQSQLRPVQDPR